MKPATKSTLFSFFYYFNLHSNSMIFSVPWDEIQWTLDFAADSVTLKLKDLIQIEIISSQKTPLLTRTCYFNRGKKILDKHLQSILIALNQQGTMEMWDGVLSSGGAQEMATSSYQVSGRHKFSLAVSDLNIYTAFRSGIDKPFSTLTLDDFEMS